MPAISPLLSKLAILITRNMKLAGKIAVIVAILLALIFGLYFAGSQGWLQNTPLRNVPYEKMGLFSQQNVEQAKELTDRAKETGEHVQQILGETVEADDKRKEKALHEKTIEYARYLYCKQVVEDWETQ